VVEEQPARPGTHGAGEDADAGSDHAAAAAPTELLGAVSGARADRRVRIFGSRVFFRLWLAQFASALGDWMGFLAIAVLAQRVGAGSGGSSGAAAVGFVMVARIAPGFFLAPVAGVLIDRLDRKKVMVVCDVARAVVLVFLPFVDTVVGLVLASLLLEIFTLMWSPAKEASVPNLVPPDRLASANSLSLVAAYGTFPLAAALFALLAGLAGWLAQFSVLDSLKVNQEALAFYFDVVTFLISAALISRLPIITGTLRAPRADVEGAPAGFRRTIADLKEGWSFIFVNPIVRSVIFGMATALIGGGMVVPLGVTFADEVLGAGASGFGVFITALGIGAAVGVLAVSVVQNRLPKVAVFTGALFLSGAGLIAAAAMSSLTLAALLVGLLGVGAGSVYVVGYTLLHEHVADDLRGRIFSTLNTMVRLCLLLAFAVGPFLSEALDQLVARLLDDRVLGLPGGRELFLPGVRLTLWLAGAIITASGVFVLRSLRGAETRRLLAERAAVNDGRSRGPGATRARGAARPPTGVPAPQNEHRPAPGSVPTDRRSPPEHPAVSVEPVSPSVERRR